MTSLRILIIDDEPALRQMLGETLREAGHQVDEADGVRAATIRLVAGDYDVALCDVRMPDGDGVELMRRMKSDGIETVFVMVTAFGSVTLAVEALRSGAHDFITKPVRNEELHHRLEQIAAMQGLRAENQALRRAAAPAGVYRFSSPSMATVQRMVEKIAPTPGTVLITGESGTGKGVTAREIHERSLYQRGPFVSVNCSAIPESLMESELFGHLKGAFTGADKPRKGLFVQADRGTLFLDEIGELPLTMQTKLLHVIEEKQVRPVGSEETRKVNVRIIAATNRDLMRMVAEGTFREDLYFRIGMFRIDLPPLRDRREDIEPLIRHLLSQPNQSGSAHGANRLDIAAEEALFDYEWPGNVRELENALIRADILADGGHITIADLPPEVTSTKRVSGMQGLSVSGTLRDQLRRFEGEILLRALEESGGDRKLAAARLGIGLSSLYRKLEEIPEVSSAKDNGG